MVMLMLQHFKRKFKSFYDDSILELIGKDIDEVITIFKYIGFNDSLRTSFSIFPHNYVLISSMDYIENLKKVFIKDFEKSDFNLTDSRLREIFITKTDD